MSTNEYRYCQHDYIETNDGKKDGYVWCRKCGDKKYKVAEYTPTYNTPVLPTGRAEEKDDQADTHNYSDGYWY